ncbi:SdiA-regulated domain-containing protein [Lewinella sp. JB7]|uniref:SdiA-regulated domain-containing protein n=1 Tax=Lewinella sp. JB7 TaxID=2962887 RepID=UPI0020CA14E5|nr:SdiA-regulated domain-containing protein [Lewinella sp. JB7]MCP9237256.1 SdiA-regulated domain-containing protein [Lewinella sp. JB7]
MNSIWERPNLISIIILVIILAVGTGYVLFTLQQRPETESFTVDDDYYFPYNFDRLDRVVKLPGELDEISGLCRGFRPDEVFAVQDEEGIMFRVNTVSGQLLQEITFGKDLDYEGLTRKDRQFYALEADGDIHTFSYTQDTLTEVESNKLETSFSYRNDTEGICYDSITNTLLIVPKAQELNPQGDNETRRGIYTYDLLENRLNNQPTYFIDGLVVGQIIFGKNREYVIKPSGIAVEPATGYIFVISAVGNILVVIDRDSQVKHVELLEQNVFRQPEGITFGPNGELYISSEGRGGHGMIATLTRNAQITNDNGSRGEGDRREN